MEPSPSDAAGLPWAAAPTWYGGWGWGQDDLPSLRYHGQPIFAIHSPSWTRSPAPRPETVSRVRPIQPAGDPLLGEHDPVADPELPDLSTRIGAFVPDPIGERADEPAELDPLAEPVELDLDELDEGAEPTREDAIDESELPHDPDAKQ